MKKISPLVGLLVLLAACSNQTSNSSSISSLSISSSSVVTSAYIDVVAPILQIDPMEVTLRYGEDFDFRSGVVAVDDIDGDVSSLVQVNVLNFDKNVPGTYMVIYVAKDKSNNTSNIVQRKITVLEKEPTIDEVGYSSRSIYTQAITGEVAQPTKTPSAFPGAWYRKVISTRDLWLGIEGTVQLPTYEFDESRYESDKSRYLDNPSVYMGGNAGSESDVGVSLMKGCDSATNCSTASLNQSYFRPFWRYITDQPNPGKYDGYSVSCIGNNCFANADFTKTEFYYAPGDVIRMSVYVAERNYLQLKIELIEPSAIEKYVEIRKNINAPSSFLSPKFRSVGQGYSTSDFKRVNAIDQVNNEAKPTILTGTKILNAIWRESFLYRKIGQEVYKVPLIERRASYMAYPIAGNEGNTSYPYQAFSITYPEGVNKELGGEAISIHPKGMDFTN